MPMLDASSGPEEHETPALKRFSENLDVLERVLRICSSNGFGPLQYLINLGAIILLRAASDWKTAGGLPFPTYAEITLTGELLRHGHALPYVELPAELSPWGRQLEQMHERLKKQFGDWLLPPGGGSLPHRSTHYPPLQTAPLPHVAKPVERRGYSWLPPLKKRLPFLIALIVATETGIASYTVNTPHTWLSSATINSGLGNKNVLGGGGDWFSQGTIFANITELLKSRSVLEAVIETLKLEETPDALRQRLSVSRLGQAGLLRVEGEASDSRAAADLVNTWVREFMKFYANQQSHEARSNHAFFESQTASARNRLSEAEKILQNFKREHVPELQANLPLRTGDLLAQRDEAHRALLAAQAALGVIQREWVQIRKDPLLTDRVVNSTPVINAGDRVKELQNHLSDAQAVYGIDSELVRTLSRQLSLAQSRLKSAAVEVEEQNPALAMIGARQVQLKAEVAMQRARLGSLNRSLAQLQPQTREASHNQITYERLQREVKVAETHYLELQNHLGQSTLAAVGAENLPISVVDPARPAEKPLGKKLLLKLLLGLLLSIGLGICVAYLAERFEEHRAAQKRREQDENSPGGHSKAA